MSNIQKIEKVFSWVGYIAQITGSLVLILVIGHYAIGFFSNTKTEVSRALDQYNGLSISGDQRQTLPVYKDLPWQADYWSEHKKVNRTHFEPYFLWRREQFSGKYINIDSDGVRQTTNKGDPSENDLKIFMFGGSTMWGTGVPDQYTIPSFLQSTLGGGYDVCNYGEAGYVSTQELNYLLHQLALNNIPDFVIFYDGVNDGYAGAYSPAIPRNPQELRTRDIKLRINNKHNYNILSQLFEESNYKKLLGYFTEQQGHQKWDEKVRVTLEVNSKEVIDIYETHIKQVNALAKEYGFQPFFFWQPNLFTGTRKLFPHEKKIVENASPVWFKSQQLVYKYAKEKFLDREDENIFFLGNIFDELEEPLYIDWCHVGPNGNKIIANQIHQRIGKILEEFRLEPDEIKSEKSDVYAQDQD